MPSTFVMLPYAALGDTRIKPQVLRTLAVISSHASNKDKTSYCSYKTLADEIGITRRVVISYVKLLEEAGYVKREGRDRKDGSQGTNILTVLFDTNLTISSGAAPQHQATEYASPTALGGAAPQHPLRDKLDPLNQNVIKKDNINKKITLAQWEEKAGATLNANMCKKWLIENRITQEVAQKLIEQFRIKCEANGNVYSNFVRAFQDRLTMGYLSLTLEGARNLSRKTENVHITNTGLSL